MIIIGDKYSYINSHKNKIIARVIETNVHLYLEEWDISFGYDYCYLITRKGHIVLKHYSELEFVESVRKEKLKRILKNVRK